MIQSIVFVSTVNLTTNPRILKEIKLALANDIKVVFVGFKLGNWSDEIDLETQLSLSGDIIFFYLDATRKPFFKWIVSSIIEKVAKKMYSLNKNSLAVNAYAHSKRSYLLNQFFAKQLFVGSMPIQPTFGIYASTQACVAPSPRMPFLFGQI